MPQHFRSGEIRYRMMGRLISLDQVGKDIEIIVLPSREISTDRQLVRNLGGAVEIALRTERTERESRDQCHVKGNATNVTSFGCLAYRNAHDATSKCWALRTITIVFPGALIVIAVRQHVANEHPPLDNHPFPVAYLLMTGRDQTVLVPANVKHD